MPLLSHVLVELLIIRPFRSISYFYGNEFYDSHNLINCILFDINPSQRQDVFCCKY